MTRGSALPHPATAQRGNATYDLAGAEPEDDATPFQSGSIFTDADDSWGDGLNFGGGATASENGQTAAVDAHFGLQSTWDYYLNVHAWEGIDGKGTATLNRVHYGHGYANAFWSDACFCMTYGDGDDPTGTWGFKTVTALDVAGHEMSHGVCTNTANLDYFGEAGGLNEANSDIHGTMVEFYARGGTHGSEVPDVGGNWTIAEQLSHLPLRYMDKPSLDGLSPDAWTLALADMDPHYSSGPMNRCFYFLSAGASSDSMQSGFTSYLPSGMTGIGNTKAIRIWFKALRDYLTSGATYHDARIACQSAATALYGANSSELAAVQNAFHGINVGPSAGLPDDASAPANVTVGVAGSSDTIVFTGSATDDVKVERIDFLVDGIVVAKLNATSGSVQVDSHLFANGHHSLQAAAYDSSGNRAVSAVMFFSVVNAFTQVLQNPGFEGGNSFWKMEGSAEIGITSALARTGQAFGILGGKGRTGSPVTGSFAQRILLPDIEGLSLDFWLWTSSTDTSGIPHDNLKIQLFDETDSLLLTTLATYTNADAAATSLDSSTPAFIRRTLDLSRFKGKTVTLKFVAEENADTLATLFRIDDLFLGRQWSDPDQNGDGLVDGIDLGILIQAYGGSIPTSSPLSDLNNDGRVDSADVLLLMKQFGQRKSQ